MPSLFALHRFAIDDSQMDWSLAEAQVAKPGKSTVVSVKSTQTAVQKRKVDEAPEAAATSNTGGKDKKTRRGGNKKAKH